MNGENKAEIATQNITSLRFLRRCSTNYDVSDLITSHIL